MSNDSTTKTTDAEEYATIRAEVMAIFPDAKCDPRGLSNYAVMDAAEMLLGCGDTPDHAWADAWNGLNKAGEVS